MAKYPWSDEPTPLTAAEIERHDGEDSFQHYIDFARDLERRLRYAKRKLAELDPTLDLGPGLE